MISLQALQRAVDRGQEELLTPPLPGRIGELRAALADEHVLVAPVADCLANGFLGTLVDGRRVDQVRAIVEQLVQDARDAVLFNLQIPDRRGTEPQDGNLQSGFTKSAAWDSHGRGSCRRKSVRRQYSARRRKGQPK